ncbi:MAG: ABC transporter permease subunit [Ruminococcus sp.]|nr:ABC transporter permease subunit [Ruminococcus sp.]MCD7726933.1 ABC transporter permease subunit [Ruminococcus sp.]MCD7773908.1 ABC transporter permease subunit [Ruminococcus sp.]
MAAIFRREFVSYFTSPIGYVFLAFFYLAAGFFFTLTSIEQGTTELNTVFSMMMYVLIVLIPILTMRTFSEEKKNKTDQCLLTAPVSLGAIVAGKFLAAFLVYALGVLIMLVFAVIVSAISSPDWLLIFGNILGLLLLGGAFISIGVFVSSLTENQIVSAVLSFAIMLVLYLFTSIASLIPVDFIANFLNSLSFLTRYDGFTYGSFDFSNILFFISVMVAFIFFTVRVLERRRWN